LVRFSKNRVVVPAGCCFKVCSTTDSKEAIKLPSGAPLGTGSADESGSELLLSFFGTFTLSLKMYLLRSIGSGC